MRCPATIPLLLQVLISTLSAAVAAALSPPRRDLSEGMEGAGESPGSAMKVIGVTGGICSGKSTLARIFSEKGVKVVDADLLGHKAYEQGSACYHSLRNAFGDGILTSSGDIDRRVLGGLVFGSKDKMKLLCDIVWPEIRRLIGLELGHLRDAGERLVVLEAAVMVEAGWQDLVDELWVVQADVDTAVQRLMQRNGLTEELARQRISAQLSAAERNKAATLVIDNNLAPEDFRRVVEELVEQQRRLAR